MIVTLTLSLGEELGWRGYLLPRLATSLGTNRGMAVTGLLHGFFHMPIIFFTPYYHPDGNRWVIVPLFLTAFTIGGLLYGYLRLTTDSVWPASLAHSANNYFWALFGGLTVATSPSRPSIWRVRVASSLSWGTVSPPRGCCSDHGFGMGLSLPAGVGLARGAD